MIDRIRHDIQQRLEQLRDETEKLGRALAALDPREKPKPRPAARSTLHAKTTPQQRSSSPRKRTPTTSKRRQATRTAPGVTKRTVLAALSTEHAMTAGDIAQATGLQRATVSTTLSKLAKTHDITKAERGYRLPKTDTHTTRA